MPNDPLNSLSSPTKVAKSSVKNVQEEGPGKGTHEIEPIRTRGVPIGTPTEIEYIPPQEDPYIMRVWDNVFNNVMGQLSPNTTVTALTSIINKSLSLADKAAEIARLHRNEIDKEQAELEQVKRNSAIKDLLNKE